MRYTQNQAPGGTVPALLSTAKSKRRFPAVSRVWSDGYHRKTMFPIGEFELQ